MSSVRKYNGNCLFGGGSISHVFAGPAIIFVIQYFLSCVISSINWYLFISPLTLSFHLFLVQPLLPVADKSSFIEFAQTRVLSRLQTTSGVRFRGKFLPV